MGKTKKVDTLSTKKLWEVKLYEENIESLSNEEKFLDNFQKKLLQCNKVNIESLAREITFHDIFQKENKVNKKVLENEVKQNKIRLGKQFINTFYLVDTPSPKNYEREYIEKLTNKTILEYIRKWGYNDKKDLHIVENLLKKLEDIKEIYRKIGYSKMKKTMEILEDTPILEDKKEIKRRYYKDLELVSKDYKKIYKKYKEKQVKSRYRLCKKYHFLVEE